MMNLKGGRALALIVGVQFLAACGGSEPAMDAASASQAVASRADPATMALYNRSCISCHGNGAGGAPRTGDRAAWQPRLEQGRDALLDHTIGGYKGMPPMGMCMDCEADQFIALIEYMSGQALK
jgi:cytochrome c5